MAKKRSSGSKDEFVALSTSENDVLAAESLSKRLDNPDVPEIARQWINDKGENLIHIFAKRGKSECISVLVKKAGLDINQKRGSDGCTPLHLAAWKGHSDCANHLVSLGASLAIQNKFGETPPMTESASIAKQVDVAKGVKRQVKAKGKKKRKQSSNSSNGQSKVKRSAKRICAELGEKKYKLIVRAVERIGVEESTKLLDQTILVEDSGGMATASGDRRRTPGGVFLALLKKRVTPEVWKDIFAEETQRKKAHRRDRRREAEAKFPLKGDAAAGVVASASVDAAAAASSTTSTAGS